MICLFLCFVVGYLNHPFILIIHDFFANILWLFVADEISVVFNECGFSLLYEVIKVLDRLNLFLLCLINLLLYIFDFIFILLRFIIDFKCILIG